MSGRGGVRGGWRGGGGGGGRGRSAPAPDPTSMEPSVATELDEKLCLTVSEPGESSSSGAPPAMAMTSADPPPPKSSKEVRVLSRPGFGTVGSFNKS
ncbi:hypothetical protein QJS04_geneDACA013057 [Acorus gramineus]|uniref:Uncharacterized protein n=1 Tax=Acorus gramineus TaxID=55184 RepID=A0AAV9B0V1_ACOGR|nr:hypothetical protein QJS04_geneDACA013057 [Acorus gramineus]